MGNKLHNRGARETAPWAPSPHQNRKDHTTDPLSLGNHFKVHCTANMLAQCLNKHLCWENINRDFLSLSNTIFFAFTSNQILQTLEVKLSNSFKEGLLWQLLCEAASDPFMHPLNKSQINACSVMVIVLGVWKGKRGSHSLCARTPKRSPRGKTRWKSQAHSRQYLGYNW